MKETSMLRVYRAILVTVLLGLSAGALGCHHATEAAPTAGPPKVTVNNPTFTRTVSEDSYTGWLRPSEEVKVRARVSGHIQKIGFSDGENVTKGQLLFQLDPRPFQAQIDQAVAQAKALEAQQKSLDADVARYTELVKTRAVTQQQLDKAIADAQYAAAQKDAMLEQVKTHQLDLEYAKITAPLAGKIGRALLTEGNYVDANGADAVLTTIVKSNPMDVYFAMDERALQQAIKSMRADKDEADDKKSLHDRNIQIRFGLETDEGYPHKAVIDYAGNQVDVETGTVEVRAEVDNSKDEFAPGYRVRVRVPVGKPYDAVLVPESAVNTDQDRKFLLVVDSKSNVKRCDVRLGRLLDDGMQVIASSTPALEKETKVIVEGMQRARLNYPVAPILEPGAGATAAQ